MNNENEQVDDDQAMVREDFMRGDIDYYDAVVRLTAILNDVHAAQEMVDGWDEQKSAA